LLDCLTLWTSNLMEAAGDDEPALERRLESFLSALETHPGRLCVVTNEVGLGIVPENALARRFRDLAGRINQQVAARATEAYLVVSGMPIRMR
jgi:adenosylcobinamide kinase/adenosylcobinamide-phosphate guanylyltransferase